MIPDGANQKFIIDKPETNKEPVIYKGIPRWLIIKQVPQFNNDGRTIKEMAKNPIEPKIINEITIQEENIWECKKCGGKIYGDTNEPFSCTQCNRETKFRKYTGPIKKGVWRLPYWVDLPKEKLDMKKTFENSVSLFWDHNGFCSLSHYCKFMAKTCCYLGNFRIFEWWNLCIKRGNSYGRD